MSNQATHPEIIVDYCYLVMRYMTNNTENLDYHNMHVISNSEQVSEILRNLSFGDKLYIDGIGDLVVVRTKPDDYRTGGDTIWRQLEIVVARKLTKKERKSLRQSDREARRMNRGRNRSYQQQEHGGRGSRGGRGGRSRRHAGRY